MTYQWNSESRKKVLGSLAQHLHNKGARDIDGFAPRLIADIANFVETKGQFPGNIEIQTVLRRLRTSLFTANRQVAKSDLASWIAKTLANEGNTAIKPLKPSETVSTCKARERYGRRTRQLSSKEKRIIREMNWRQANKRFFDGLSALEQAMLQSDHYKVCIECLTNENLHHITSRALIKCTDYYMCQECLDYYNNK